MTALGTAGTPVDAGEGKVAGTPGGTPIAHLVSASILILVLVLSACFAVLLTLAVRHEFEQIQRRDREEKLLAIGQLFQSFLDTRLNVLHHHSHFPLIVQAVMHPGQDRAVVADFLSDLSILGEHYPLALLDFEGQVIHRTSALPGFNYGSSPWVASLLSAHTHSDSARGPAAMPDHSSMHADSHCAISTDAAAGHYWRLAVPVHHGGLVEGVLVAEVPLAEFEKTGILSGLLDEACLELRRGEARIIRLGTKGEGTQVRLDLSPVGVSLIYSTDQSDIRAAYRSTMVHIIAVLAVVTLLAVAAALALARRSIVMPLAGLHEMVTSLADDCEPAAAPRRHRVREIRVLSAHFATMAARVRERGAALREARDELEARVAARTKELAAREAVHRALIENLTQCVFLKDTESRFVSANGSFCRFVGAAIEDLIGKTDHDLFPSALAEKYRQDDRRVMETGTVLEQVEEHVRAGKTLWVEAVKTPVRDEAGNVTGLLGIFWDVTEERLREAHARQKQKLESLGTLAGGVAHEINNPINGIMNYAQLILDGVTPGSEAAEFADEIINESWRVAGIVRSLLAFARDEREVPALADIGEIVEHIVPLIRTIIRRDQIQFETDVPDASLPVRCCSQQIQQVLLNLLANACEALNARFPGYSEGKTMRLSVRQFERAASPWVRITVEDHGIGIPEDVRERMFDPFFTTKDRALGTGLGLSISHGIVSEHGGELRVESEVGKFTRFHLELPACV